MKSPSCATRVEEHDGSSPVSSLMRFDIPVGGRGALGGNGSGQLEMCDFSYR
jgi:hypothetical protein